MPESVVRWGTLVRVLAYVIRFANNCRERQMNRETRKLSVDEIRDSEIALIKQAQKDEFSNEIVPEEGQGC
ncbi:hypothetical protein HOLleu_02972 [Holothuria leucospilota]|uniref:Uncharacterized protein n=1 Tax=Holothuria leucospilota TaxID=206669 RepID=A0A9Q1HL49_HOLLE|nr:hypothetical protein HOLleu_02972 [Holothuria leucospilota]